MVGATEGLMQELEQEARVTRAVLERVPEDRMGWRPHPKSMSLGELALHIAMLPEAIARLSLAPTFDVSTPVPLPGSASSEELLSIHDGSVAAAREVLSGMAESDLGLPWRMMDGEVEVMGITRGALLRSVLLNHVYHHRGQLTVYLRLLDVAVPPVYGPTADENPFAP